MGQEKVAGSGSDSERPLPAFFVYLIKILSLVMVLFTMYTGFFGLFEPFVQRGIFLSFPVFFSFLIYPATRRLKGESLIFWFDLLLAIVGAAACLYVAVFNIALQNRAGEPLWIDILLGSVLMVLLLESGRRSMGYPLPVITIGMVLYAYFGPWMPAIIAHKGASVRALSSFIYLTPEGIWGIPVAVAASFLFLFVLFGTLLTEAKVGDLVLDLSYALAGKARGGPAKVSVVASGLFGSISGAAVANVVTTGSFTIPLMKRVGYPAYYAGAVESTASTGGIIMPPIMGAAAFIMADLMNVNYFEVVKAAIVPGILYYVGLFAMVHFRAVKLDLKPIIANRRGKKILGLLIKQGYLLLPVLVLIWYLIILRKSAALSAFYGNLAAVGTIIVKSYLDGNLREIPSVLIAACYKSAKVMIMVAVACALAGIIIGCAIQTGLAIRFSTMLIDFAGESLSVLLVVAMIASFILGIGVTATVAYIIPAILVVPAMIEAGVSPMAANMFCFYFAVISYITPPVALAAYAAAGLADSNPFKTGVTATQLGLAGFILPYMFVYNPALILEGNLLRLLTAVPTAVLGMICLGAALEGWFLMKATVLDRLLLTFAAFSLIKPGMETDLLGIILAVTVLLFQYYRRKTRLVLLEKKVK